MNSSAQPSESTVSLLEDLIGFDTTSRYSNLEIIDYLRAYLEGFGVHCEQSWNEQKTKANLFATLGEDKAPGIVLSGHTDVVPVTGQNWSTDPFNAEIKDGLLYGRGSCDMKGFIATCLTKTQMILDADLPIPMHFAFSYDEEVGCFGAVKMIEQLQQRAVLPKACIIGEPTSMGVVRAHKGILVKRCHVKGKASHSSLVQHGVNAVTAAAKTISHIDTIAQRIKNEGPFDTLFDPPYTTLNTGLINGGTAINIIPESCSFDFEIRNIPQQSAVPLFAEVEAYSRSLEPPMKAVDVEAGFDWQTIARFPGMDTDQSAEVIQLVSQVLGDFSEPGKVSYGTEGGLFHEAGIPTVICGPGSIEQAHKPDEYVALEQLAQCESFIDTLVNTLKTP